ncbi:MAG: outer membrane lipoprotein carrier protein LolA [Treponema sp.]|nr:outer membrane lipoprotein carrier protein LolA [Treponema sp.]MBQ2551341.1 outer membrane lipoprotein carrier protein LolA [Treponema sp.]MBQ4237082.1 outer membrane lipoprotein carrier protein LolA [Treponema sp.]MBQ5384199.1 outer membrane lipoprotein carrier protein LolA [Treponema sp.]
MKKLVICLAGLLFASTLAFSQIVTASSYFNDVSDFYAGLYTYRCDIAADSDGRQMKGSLAYSRPQLLRISFNRQGGQLLIFDGTTLQLYLPGQEILLQQTIDDKTADDSTISPRGLTLFKRYYTISFETDATPVPLDQGSEEKVVNLMLYRRATSEAFESIKLSIEPETKLIRRVVATTPQGQVYKIDLTNYRLNVKVGSGEFYFDPPAHVTSYNNFLFQE